MLSIFFSGSGALMKLLQNLKTPISLAILQTATATSWKEKLEEQYVDLYSDRTVAP